jgi:hypothetical protein
MLLPNTRRDQKRRPVDQDAFVTEMEAIKSLGQEIAKLATPAGMAQPP